MDTASMRQHTGECTHTHTPLSLSLSHTHTHTVTHTLTATATHAQTNNTHPQVTTVFKSVVRKSPKR